MFQTAQVIKTSRVSFKPSDMDQEWETKQQRKNKRQKIDRRKGRDNKRNQL